MNKSSLVPRTPPVHPAPFGRVGYTAGWSGYAVVQAWGLTPAAAVRRWRRKVTRQQRKEEKASRVW
jgi:hypothetical protein